MHIEHVAMWVRDLERMRAFYETYFGAIANTRYVNVTKRFQSYFLRFPNNGPRLELMQMPEVGEHPANGEWVGFTHIAFSVGSESEVDTFTDRLRADGYAVIDGPRRTGDGYYESVVLDPEKNRIEITV